MQFEINERIPTEELQEAPTDGLMMAAPMLPESWKAAFDRVAEIVKAKFIESLPEWSVVEAAIKTAVDAWLGGKVPPFAIRIALNYILPIVEEFYNDLKHKRGLVTG